MITKKAIKATEFKMKAYNFVKAVMMNDHDYDLYDDNDVSNLRHEYGFDNGIPGAYAKDLHELVTSYSIDKDGNVTGNTWTPTEKQAEALYGFDAMIEHSIIFID